MRSKLLYVVLMFALTPTLTHATINPNLPDLGEPYERNIDFRDIRDAFSNGNYDLGLNLIYEKLYEKSRQALLDEKNIKVIIEKVAEKLQEIMNDPNLSDIEKGDQVVKEILSTLEPYEYVTSDSMNTSIKYSIEYGAVYLTWNEKTEFDSCWGVYLEVQSNDCDPFDYYCEDFTYTYVYRKEYLTQVPDYYIYRVINGQDKLITKIKGYANINLKAYSFNVDDGWKNAKNVYDYYREIPEASLEDGRLFWLDLHSDVRELGESLSYKVVADHRPYKQNDCGTSNLYSSTISADSDGDGKIDFIPESEYQKLFGKYYGWLIPVITMIN